VNPNQKSYLTINEISTPITTPQSVPSNEQSEIVEDSDARPFLYYNESEGEVNESERINTDGSRGVGGARTESVSETEKGNASCFFQRILNEARRWGEECSQIKEMRKEATNENLLTDFSDLMEAWVYHLFIPSTSHASVTRDYRTIDLATRFIESVRQNTMVM
jgi:hypothetical protein